VQTRLVEAYENLQNFTQAFETAKNMYFEEPDFERYKYARRRAEKVAEAPAFFALAEANEKQNASDHIYSSLLRDIYSYEGETKKLMDMAMAKDIEKNYYDRKYIARSLIYRAVSDADGLGDYLLKYLASAVGEGGIEDMLKYGGDPPQQAKWLRGGADLLKGMIAFHIGAAKRNRYAKAAYYMSVLRDIFIFLGHEDDFQNYYRDVMAQNSRRPALRDEMRIVYGSSSSKD
jgi:hypothetical protein